MDKLIKEYSDRLQAIYDNRTAGDYSFAGILGEFAKRAHIEAIAEWREGQDN